VNESDGRTLFVAREAARRPIIGAVTSQISTGVRDGARLAKAMPFDQLTPERACATLKSVGFRFRPDEVRIDARDERWLVRLPGARLAWFAASEAGRKILVTERRVLRLLAAKCSFLVPRVLLEGDTGEFDLRAMVPGDAEPWDVYARARDAAHVSARLGAAVGAILAQQHTRIESKEAADWLPDRPGWPMPREWISARLARVVDDVELIERADAVMSGYEALTIAQEDRVLVHGDIGFHNLGITLNTCTVHGVFDYADVSWADRHHDFRYLLFDLDRDEMLEAALSVYEPATQRIIDRSRVCLYNAACAVTFLAYRDGTAPGDRSCGRTLAEDLRWSNHALARALPSL
jgi:hypothetical protein